MTIFADVISILSGGASRNAGVQSGAPRSYANQPATTVNQDTAMQLSAVWACVRIITESIGSLPINVYKLSDGGVRTPYYDHPLSLLFRNKPNRWQTRQNYFESIIYQFVLQGNDYTAIQRDSKDRIIGLIPLMTPQMQVHLEKSGNVRYEYQDNAGVRVYSDKSIWHNKLYGNGIVGLSPLGHARNTVAVGQAAEMATTKVYRNGGKPSGLLTIDKVLKKEQREAVKANFAELSEGNSDRLFVLEAGMEYTQVSLSPQDIELLQSRRFQIEDVCRFFGVPSVLVNDSAQNTAWGSGIEQLIQGFYKFGLRPYMERYENSMKSNLLNPLERDTIDIEFDFNALLRPDLNDRIKGHGEGVQKGIITPNEARTIEGWKPLPGGDTLYMQQQMAPIETLKDLDRKGISNENKRTND